MHVGWLVCTCWLENHCKSHVYFYHRPGGGIAFRNGHKIIHLQKPKHSVTVCCVIAVMFVHNYFIHNRIFGLGGNSLYVYINTVRDWGINSSPRIFCFVLGGESTPLYETLRTLVHEMSKLMATMKFKAQHKLDVMQP